MGTTEQLCRIISRTRFSNLGAATVARTIEAIKDGIAVALAGCDEAPVRLYAQHIRSLGGARASSAWGQGFKSSTVQAATINAMATHVLDFEPMWTPPTHAVSPTVPVAFALAEAMKRNGRELVAAVAKGMEVQARLLLAGSQFQPEALRFHPPGVAGVLGAAVTAGHLLGLNEHKLRHALGIAGSRAGSLLANAGSMTKCTHPGYAAGLGLDAALLAARGFTGNPDILEAHKGFAETFFPDGFDAAPLLAYGRPFRVVDPGLAIKLFPSQFGTHYAISAALRMHARLGGAGEIARVTITTPVMKYVDRPQPASGLDGKFSFQYTAAAALLDGKVDIDTFTDKRRFSADMVALLGKIRLIQTDAIPGEWRAMRVEIEATLRDGRRERALCDGPSGSWGHPLGAGDHLRKLDDCLGRHMPAARVKRLLDAIDALPRGRPGAVATIVKLIAARRASPRRRAA